jgi:hypothetical protein
VRLQSVIVILASLPRLNAERTQTLDQGTADEFGRGGEVTSSGSR